MPDASVVRAARSSRAAANPLLSTCTGIKPRDSLAANDGHGFFEALGDSVVTGPTMTNVNDFRAVLIGSDATEK